MGCFFPFSQPRKYYIKNCRSEFLGEAVSEKLTRQQQTSQLPAGILISIKVLLRRDIIQGSKRPKRQQ